MTPAGHLLSGYMAGGLAAAGVTGRRERFTIIGVGVLAAIAPDFDVAFGLVGGYLAAGWHRGATHSFLAVVLAGALAAALLPGMRRAAFLAGAGGVLTHLFWDGMNFWGVCLFWPRLRYFSTGLLHEGDWIALGIAAVGAALVWQDRRTAAVVFLAASLAAYLAFQMKSREHARGLVRTELYGRRTGVYPSRELGCGWVVLSEGEGDLRVHCLAPFGRQLRERLVVHRKGGFFTQASRLSPSVQEFLHDAPFAFAEEHPAPEGGALVIWRDLREVHQEGDAAVPAGLHIELDSGGRIVRERHRWWLSVW
jgi:membrane-bound metal-dependent hydrolase YbcI (DUF457 family)